jgi:hypothetical protein
MRSATLLIFFGLLHAQFAAGQASTGNYWNPVSEKEIPAGGTRQIIPLKYVTFSLDAAQLKSLLWNAPHESRQNIGQSNCVITMPTPDGSLSRFRVVESPVMSSELAAAFPQIKTFSIKGIDDPYANGKIDLNEFGFHGMVFSVNGDYFVDPYNNLSVNHYLSYYTADFVKKPEHTLPEAGVIRDEPERKIRSAEEKTGARLMAPAVCVGAKLRSFRLAVACTGEYATAATGISAPNVSQVLSKIVTSVNRVDGVYEKEVSVRLVLIATETVVVYTDASTDPFTGNNNSNTLIGESQTVINGNIGSANYDIGHTFSTGGGGLANLGCVCSSVNKAKGITGSPSPVGDPYDIDYVAHEMGHQFGGEHSFNATTGSCNGNRNASSSVEPGGGVTIMAYAGICGSNDVIANSLPYFHAISYDQIVNFTNSGGGSSCAVQISTGNQPPLVTGSGNYTIPKSTPFKLTGSGSDPDGDPITFSWEECDNGLAAGNWNSGNKPYFRSYTPTVSPSRLFPINAVAFSGNFTGTRGEYLPPSAQTLQFRLTARDNKMGGGGVCYAINYITVDDAGPLMVSYPSATGITWFSASQQTVTWDVNATDLPPVSCDSVRILITYNSGNTYTVLNFSTPNDGSEQITVPTVTGPITTCRIRVESIGNIFYDMSNNNFTITVNPDPDPDVSVKTIPGENPGLVIWPNPAGTQVNVSAGQLDENKTTVISVTDVLGRTILQKEFGHRKNIRETLDFSAVSQGLYFIELNNGGRHAVHRLVKE